MGRPKPGPAELMGEAGWRIVRGSPTAEEVAALAVVLAARLRAPAPAAGGTAVRAVVRWRPDRTDPAAARSWAAQPRPGWRSAA
ncbi:hypothetical protein V1J52_14525 [Streptomyces sp. TRM 70351]|uniref:hypothetical protein n=1 Tax=Streptomyces sp. TRM 70351 TaxID=3116552 RepID=UPI002E7B38DF|nr:hypothetical protein [Streptomyces sp. TRM 70351]MEE1929381.1 hypothetical protein [Streptomyces sp. TRM 70351]